MHIIVRDDLFYIIEGMSEEVATELHNIIVSTGRKNTDLYFTTYRTIMGLPTGITMKEERQILAERYGEDIINNEKFVSDTRLAQKEFESKKTTLPDLIGWLERLGVKVTLANEIFYV